MGGCRQLTARTHSGVCCPTAPHVRCRDAECPADGPTRSKDCCGHLALANRYTALDDLAVLQRPVLSLGPYTNPRQ